MPAQQSQESHLPSPDTSAAGSDSGRLEDLKGGGFSDLVNDHHHPQHHQQQKRLPARTAAAATTHSLPQQQTSLPKNKTTTPVANPSTGSSTSSAGKSKSKSKTKSKTNPPQQTAQETAGKSNITITTTSTTTTTTAKMSARSSAALPASRRAAPISIQIVRLASSTTITSYSQSSSTSSSSKAAGVAEAGDRSSSSKNDPQSHAFTMNMLPMTKIRELCLHAAGHARRHNLGGSGGAGGVLDGSRFEARDRDGHVFNGHETLSEEILRGETIYLIEGGLDARGEATGKAAGKAVMGKVSSKAGGEKPRTTSARERGRLLCLKELELEGDKGEGDKCEGKRARTPYRTPSVSSRASATSSSRSESKGRAGTTRMTPSQKALAIAQMGRTPATKEQAAVGRKLPTSSAVRKSLPSPALEKVEEATNREARGRATHRSGGAEIDDIDADLVAASPLRSPSPPPLPPQPHQQQHSVPSHLQDSQLVIPDSQDPFSQGLFSQQSVEPDHPTPAFPTPDTSRTQSRPPPHVKATVLQPKQPACRPDPYDINNVLSDDDDDDDDDDERSDGSTRSNKMAPSVRKLGSASAARRASVAAPPVLLPSPRLHQLSEGEPLRGSRGVAVPTAARTKTPTPTKRATPVKAGPSSPAVPLPSSPTAHVAAAIAKGGERFARKDRKSSLPSPGQLVYKIRSESDSDDELIEEAFRDLSSSIPTPSLPWSAPPLRAKPDPATAVDKRSPRKSPLAGKKAGNEKNGTSAEDEVFIVGVSPRKSPLKKPLGTSPGKKSTQKSPSKEPLGTSPGKKASQKSPTQATIITSPSKKEDSTIIHDSSRTSSDAEGDIVIIKKEPAVNEESSPQKAKLQDIPNMDESPSRMLGKQLEVIELSSGSESDIDPSWDMIEDDEAELPSFDVQPLEEQEKLPLPKPAQANRSPAQNSPKTDPLKIEPRYKQEPPSAQASKRKRPASEEPEPEDEQHRRKRIKREAKKARKKQNREHKAARRLQEQSERQLAALQEERKKLALEKAHRRALELEMIVSSPVKRESSTDPSEEGDDEADSGLGSSAYGNDTGANNHDDAAAAGRAGVPLDGDDKNDSLSSREAEGCGGGLYHPSWRKVSKLHLSSPPASTPAMLEAQLEQCAEERFHRMPFDDWAFLESTLGKGSLSGGRYGYSPLEVHNRVHLDMVGRSQRLRARASDMGGHGNYPRAAEEIDPESPALSSETGDDESRSQRSEAPSPKEDRAEKAKTDRVREELREQLREQMRVAKATETKGAKKDEKLRKERARKKQRKQKANCRYHQNFRCSRLGGGEKGKKKQKDGRKGH